VIAFAAIYFVLFLVITPFLFLVHRKILADPYSSLGLLFVSFLSLGTILFSGNHVGDQISGKAINISKEGLGVILRSNISLGTQAQLTIYSDEEQSTGSGEVIWKKEVKGRTVHGIKISQWSYLDPSLESQILLH